MVANVDAQPDPNQTQTGKRSKALGPLSHPRLSIEVWRHCGRLFIAAYDAKGVPKMTRALTLAAAVTTALILGHATATTWNNAAHVVAPY